ncbi:hypothetical protein SDC9_134854 [bioreactor metagenome]|uniref:Uncharacterized protein n=1 Tax=bioreactor metagenome TaxID=1076179 RepID=A0A645DEA2_9ZZZZ
MFAESQVEIHRDGQNGNDNHIQRIHLSKDRWEPSHFRRLIDDANRVGAKRVFPKSNEVTRQLNGDIVHHQREQGFVCIPACLKHGGNRTPDAAGHHAAKEHDHNQRKTRQRPAKVDHAGGSGEPADQNLSFRADVPETHFERRCEANRDAKEHHNITNGHPNALVGTKRSLEHCRVNLQWV